jgi:starvation-inducible DNA-binding protein
MVSRVEDRSRSDRVRPVISDKSDEIQPYGSIVQLPIAMSEEACSSSVGDLNQLLADSITLRDLYKKHHWQVVGPTFYPLHLLFDKHADEQSKLIDLIAERIQTLGGVSVAMAHDVAEVTNIPRPPRGRESVPVQISRLLRAHEIILEEARPMIHRTEQTGDWGTNDLLMSDVIRTNELQVWFVSQHLVDEPLVRAQEEHTS